MRENVLRANLLDAVETSNVFEAKIPRAEATPRTTAGWNAEDFAREQIQGLVRRLFLSQGRRPVRQVVFSAVDAEADVRGLCRSVGEALARETEATVAVLNRDANVLREVRVNSDKKHEKDDEAGKPLRRIASRVHDNLWVVPDLGGNDVTKASLHSYLGEMRREFEYSIVEAPSAGESNLAATMAQFADGIVLVLSAHRTRRVTARSVKDALENVQARVLGTVLADRMFPIPERIYRRL